MKRTDIPARNAAEFVRTGNAPAHGASKLGGSPDLPENFVWPYYKGEDFEGEIGNRPLTFLLQIDLREVSRYDTEHRLPAEGHLWFFYDMATMRWGFEKEDHGCARVYYSDLPKEMLFPTEPPEEGIPVPESGLAFEAKENLPCYEEYLCSADTDPGWEEYDGLRNEERSPEYIFKLLGYADLIQGPITVEKELLSRGKTWDTYRKMSNPEQKKLKRESAGWVLLAQFGTISDELMFGDCGCLYFYIKDSDLAAGRFENAEISLQCG